MADAQYISYTGETTESCLVLSHMRCFVLFLKLKTRLFTNTPIRMHTCGHIEQQCAYIIYPPYR